MSNSHIYFKFIFFLIANNDTLTILRAMQEYHNKTCIKFRPYQKEDINWIQIMGDYSGCWSSVGMQGGGQVNKLFINI